MMNIRSHGPQRRLSGARRSQTEPAQRAIVPLGLMQRCHVRDDVADYFC
jgi:hypothetical protein